MPFVDSGGSPIVLSNLTNGEPIRARLRAWNSAGSSLATAEIIVTPSAGALVTSATGSAAPIQVPQTVLIDGQFYDVQVVSHFAGQPDEVTAAVLAEFTAPAVVPVGPLRYAPPTLVNPTVINVPVIGGAYNHLAQMDQDFLWVMPDEPVTGSLTINGGRNNVMIGGHFSSDRWLRNYGATNPSQRYTWEKAACLFIDRWADTWHIEGVIGDTLGQGLNINRDQWIPGMADQFHDFISSWSDVPGSRLVVQNTWGRTRHIRTNTADKGDLIQTMRGPASVHVDRFDGVHNGQGMFLSSANLSGYPTFDPHTFRDVYIWRQDDSQGYSFGLWPETIEVTFENCHSRVDYLERGGDLDTPNEHQWTRSLNPPAGGANVDLDAIGIGYVSPGYEA